MVRSISNQYVKKQSNQHTTPKTPRAASTYVPTTTSIAGVITSKPSSFRTYKKYLGISVLEKVRRRDILGEHLNSNYQLKILTNAGDKLDYEQKTNWIFYCDVIDSSYLSYSELYR